ncbi:MAG: hypothetical protein LBT99_01790 [Bifidobacteriaceae bacterium]|jgi:hypothetical protein|nr:hypothetical protein [Bifidobacteriaceae bacterium]
MEIRKNWNKFSFKKLGIVFCLFLFGVVAFVSGNLSQVNAASSSTVLPVAKGGTGSNSANGARTNLNAQERLVSGTNIKSIFGQSLLGAGNVTNISQINTSDCNLTVGQRYIAQNVGYQNGKSINGLHFNYRAYNDFDIQFAQPAWTYSHMIYTSNTHETKSFTSTAYANKVNEWIMTCDSCYFSGQISTVYNEGQTRVKLSISGTISGADGVTLTIDRLY